MRASQRRARAGFTLLELGIVIGVSAILAAAIVPDLIETMRNKMAEKAAGDVAIIHDAARLYYIQDRALSTACSAGGCWPGEQQPGGCAVNFQPGNATQRLLAGGYLAGGGGPANPLPGPNFLKNPWGKPYEFTVYAPVAAPAPGPACLFGVITNVPEVIKDGFISFLPQAGCNDPAAGLTPCPLLPLPPAGFARCCSYVPKPGATFNGPCPSGTTVQNSGGFLKCL